MYQVNLGDKILYYPANDDYSIYDTEWSESVGLAGEFTFKVPPQNPLYGSLANGSIVTILQDGTEVWRGEIKNIDTDFAKIATVYCVEDLAWLADEYMTPAQITNETYAQRFQAAIDAYNLNRSSDRQFAVGYITNSANPSVDLCNWTTEYEWSILDDLRNCIARDDGYLRVRRVTVGGVVTRYIDCVKLSDYGVQATQPIQYGVNLLDYVKESDYGNLTNVLVPYGAELEAEVYTDYSQRLQGTAIQNDASITAYGRHAKNVVFDGVEDLATLNSLAASYLSRYCQPQLTMEVKAVDLADVESVAEIHIGDSVRIVAPAFAVDQWLYLTEIKRDLQNVDKNSITLCGHVSTGRTITSQANTTADVVKNMPSKDSLLESAKRNALRLLNGAEGGIVSFVTNSDDQIVEMTITNNMDESEVTKRWRWNISGLAYQERPTKNDDWDDYPPSVAMTVDGAIVADFITSGTINANRVTINGKIEATSGYIGTNGTNGWNIGSKGIYNGCTGISNGTDGVYVGADGIRCNGTVSGVPGGYVRVAGGQLSSNTMLLAAGLGAVGGGDAAISGTYSTGGETGKTTDTFSFQANVNGSTRTIALRFSNGILVGIGGF